MKLVSFRIAAAFLVSFFLAASARSQNSYIGFRLGDVISLGEKRINPDVVDYSKTAIILFGPVLYFSLGYKIDSRIAVEIRPGAGISPMGGEVGFYVKYFVRPSKIYFLGSIGWRGNVDADGNSGGEYPGPFLVPGIGLGLSDEHTSLNYHS